VQRWGRTKQNKTKPPTTKNPTNKKKNKKKKTPPHNKKKGGGGREGGVSKGGKGASGVVGVEVAAKKITQKWIPPINNLEETTRDCRNLKKIQAHCRKRAHPQAVLNSKPRRLAPGRESATGRRKRKELGANKSSAKGGDGRGVLIGRIAGKKTQ